MSQTQECLDQCLSIRSLSDLTGLEDETVTAARVYGCKGLSLRSCLVFANSITSNKQLRDLDLTYLQCTKLGAAELMRGLAKSQVARLAVSFEPRDDVWIGLVGGLEYLHTVQTLSIRFNSKLSKKLMPNLNRFLADNLPRLKHIPNVLITSGKHHGHPSSCFYTVFLSISNSSKTLRDLHLVIDDESNLRCIETLGSMLSLDSLRTLKVSIHQTSPTELQALFAFIRNCRELETLVCHYDNLQSLKRHQVLEFLEIVRSYHQPKKILFPIPHRFESISSIRMAMKTLLQSKPTLVEFCIGARKDAVAYQLARNQIHYQRLLMDLVPLQLWPSILEKKLFFGHRSGHPGATLRSFAKIQAVYDLMREKNGVLIRSRR